MRKLCRIVFSRYTICALAIGIDIALMTYIVMRSVTLYIWLAGVALLVDVCVVLSLINRDANPEFKVSWLVVVLVLPLFGAILYLLFYRRRMSRSDAKRMEHVMKELSHIEDRGHGFCPEHVSTLSLLSKKNKYVSGQAYSLLGSDPLSCIFVGSECRYFDSGEELYSEMLSAIESAESYIFLEYFIISEGEMWQGIYERLLKKQSEGVDVRILYDDIGCMSTLPADYERKLRRQGISCYRFSKVTPKVTSVHNNRDHRKLLIVDGRVAFTGGVNIADEYINKKIRFKHWKDGGVMLRGDAVRGFTKLFLSLYDFTAAKRSDYEALLKKEDCGRELGLSAYDTDNPNSVSEAQTEGGFFIPFGTGPYPVYKSQVGKRAILNAVNGAQSYVYVTTPYLIMDYELTDAFRAAASRGVDIRIITPGVADKKIVKIMTKSAYEGLIKGGVRIFEYCPGFIHEKMLIADGELAIIGTINLDYRSLVHHFECALWIYGSGEISEMRKGFMKTLKDSREITESTAKLSFPESIVRYAVRLFAPLM